MFGRVHRLAVSSAVRSRGLGLAVLLMLSVLGLLALPACTDYAERARLSEAEAQRLRGEAAELEDRVAAAESDALTLRDRLAAAEADAERAVTLAENLARRAAEAAAASDPDAALLASEAERAKAAAERIAEGVGTLEQADALATRYLDEGRRQARAWLDEAERLQSAANDDRERVANGDTQFVAALDTAGSLTDLLAIFWPGAAAVGAGLAGVAELARRRAREEAERAQVAATAAAVKGETFSDHLQRLVESIEKVKHTGGGVIDFTVAGDALRRNFGPELAGLVEQLRGQFKARRAINNPSAPSIERPA